MPLRLGVPEVLNFQNFEEQPRHKLQQTSVFSTLDLEWNCRTWVLDWERRVLRGRAVPPRKYRSVCCFSLSHYHDVRECLARYHDNCKEQVGQDRFVWTSYVSALVQKHRKLQPWINMKPNGCTLNRCLYPLLRLGFYLKVTDDDLVSVIVAEIIKCTGSLEFMFNFYPGMSLTLYTLLLWSNSSSLFDSLMTKEYFSMIFAEGRTREVLPKDLYKCSAPYLKYLITRLRPLHAKGDHAHPDSFNLKTLLERPFDNTCTSSAYRSYPLLTLGIMFHDAELVHLLVHRGASLQASYFDYDSDCLSTAEEKMVTMINTLLISEQFLSKCGNDISEHIDSFVFQISTYLPLLKRSMLRPNVSKACGVWRGGREPTELNRHVAEEWGIGHTPPFPSLLSICKFVIREQILQADNTLLPSAIAMLPIPEMLKAYVGLHLD